MKKLVAEDYNQFQRGFNNPYKALKIGYSISKPSININMTSSDTSFWDSSFTFIATPDEIMKKIIDPLNITIKDYKKYSHEFNTNFLFFLETKFGIFTIYESYKQKHMLKDKKIEWYIGAKTFEIAKESLKAVKIALNI